MALNTLPICKINARKAVKRLVSMLLSIAMLLSIVTAMSFSVSANSNVTTFEYDGYTVKYEITNSWNNGQNNNVKVTVTNTGVKTIENWMLEYDFMGTAIMQSGGTIFEEGEITYVKNVGTNLAGYGNSININSGMSVNFSYSLMNPTGTPDYFTLCQERVSLEQGVDYAVTLNPQLDYGTSFQGQILIENLTNKPIECWELTFAGSNFTIQNSWEGKLIDLGNGRNMIKPIAGNIVRIAPNSTLTLGFQANKDSNLGFDDLEIAFEGLTGVVVENPFNKAGDYLTSSKKEILIGKESNTVYFYVHTFEATANITLYENDVPVAVFYDNGNYAAYGDDMMGDGVYSAKLNIDTTTANNITNTYYAKLDGKFTSNEVSINLIIPFTAQELSEMEYVDDLIKTVMLANATPDYLKQVPSEFVQNGSDDPDWEEYAIIFEQRYNALVDALDSLIIEDKVSSYNYDEVNRVFNCQYSNSVWFFVVPDDILESFMYSSDIVRALDYSGINTLILNAFEDTNYRTNFYEDLVGEWRENGMTVDYDDYVTVTDLRTKLSNKDIITLSGHGMVFNSRSVFCLEETATADTDTSYNADIVAGRVERVNYADGTSSYVVYSDFFTHYYGSNGLDKSFVFSESCMFMGADDALGFDNTFANALISCSAEAVIGFENSVMADYSRELMVYYIEELATGATSSDAFNSARQVYGNHDLDYRMPGFFEFLFDSGLFGGDDAFDKMGATAFPHLTGDNNALLAKVSDDLINANFEILFQSLTSIPLGWQRTGDARVISKLGNINSYGNRMAFISTGIGSQIGSNISGTQGSTLTQSFRNSNNMTIKFNYNFVSEEPMEYIGSRYDDKFEVRILDSSNNVLYNEILAAVNTSTWSSVSGINFDGGDSTVFQTGWETKSINISAYQSQNIKIQFLVYDVGDSAYDSAALIDNVEFG